MSAYRIVQGSAQNVAFAAAGGASAQSAAFGSQTRAIRVCVPIPYSGTGSTAVGVRIEIGDNPTASASSALLPGNEPEVFIVSPGQKIAVLSNDATTGNLNVVQLTN